MVEKDILQLSLEELLAIGPNLEDLMALLQTGKLKFIKVDEEDLPTSPMTTDESTESVQTEK